MAAEDVKVTKTGNIYTLSKNNCKVTITDVDNNGLTGNDSIMVKGDIKNSGISAADISKALSDNGYKPGETKGSFEDVKVNNNTVIFKQEKKYNLSSFERFLHSAAETQTQPQAPATQVQRTPKNSPEANSNLYSNVDVQSIQKDVSKWSAFTSLLSVGGLMGAESITGGGFLGNLLMPAAMGSIASGLYGDMQSSFNAGQTNDSGNEKLQAILEKALSPVTAEEEAAFKAKTSSTTVDPDNNITAPENSDSIVLDEAEPERTVVKSKTLADGSTVTEYSDGVQEIIYKDGTKSEMYVDDNGDKHVTRYDKEGEFTEEVTQFEDHKMTTYADGRTVKEFKGGEKNESHTDTNGNLIIVRYDKNQKLVDVQCVDPDNKVTIAKANGKWSVEELTAALIKAKGQTPAKTAESKKAEVSAICQDLYKAMKDVGTNEELLETTVSKINKDNVLEVLESWEKGALGKDYGETSLIMAIQGEIEDHSSAYMITPITGLFMKFSDTYLNPIKEALIERTQNQETKELDVIIKSKYERPIKIDNSGAAEAIQDLYERVKKEEEERKTTEQ